MISPRPLGLNLMFMPKADFEVVKATQCGLYPETRADLPWTIGSRARLLDRGCTTDVLDCNAGILTNGRRVTTFHLEPTSSPFLQIRRQLGADIAELRRETPSTPVRAILTGGISTSNKIGTDSHRLYEHLMNVFGLNGINGQQISRLWGGSDRKRVDLVALPEHRTVCFSVNEVNGHGDVVRSVTQPKDLRSLFRRVRVSPLDHLVFPGSRDYQQAFLELTENWHEVLRAIQRIKFRVPA